MKPQEMLLVSPPELKVVNVGPDTFLVNYKFEDEEGNLTGDSLPDHMVELLDVWQQEARAAHAPVPTDLVFSYRAGRESYSQTLYMRLHGSSLWSWLLFSDDIRLNFAYGTVNRGLFCQARFSSHLLHTIGACEAMLSVEALLHELLGSLFHEQASEVHLCADIQGFDFSTIRLIGDQLPFVSRVTTIRDRLVPPTQREQEGGLSVREMSEVEAQIVQETATLHEVEQFHQPSVLTTHRRVATIDFGSHASDISAQIYNKSLEIIKHQKEWIKRIWLDNGWDGKSVVWRIEFRFKRAFLRTFELDEAFSVLQQVHLLWQYATCEWLRFVDLEEPHGANVSRLPTHPVWQVVQGAYGRFTQESRMIADDASEQDARVEHLLHTHPEKVIEYAATQQVAETVQQEFQEVPLLSHEEYGALLSWFPPVAAFSFWRCVLTVAYVHGLVCRRLHHGLGVDLSGLRQILRIRPLSVEELLDKIRLTRMRREHQAVEQFLQGVAIEDVRELARDVINTLTSEQVEHLITHLSSWSFVEVRTVLVKRDRRMAKAKARLSACLGNLRAAIALTAPEEFAGVADLFSSVLWLYEQGRRYDQQKRRDHREEVHKKQLAYGFVSAQQIEEERRRYGAILCKEDYAAIDRVLADLRTTQKSGKSRGKFDEEWERSAMSEQEVPA